MFKKIFSDYKKRPKTQMFVQSSVAQLLAEGRQMAQLQVSGCPSYCLSPNCWWLQHRQTCKQTQRRTELFRQCDKNTEKCNLKGVQGYLVNSSGLGKSKQELEAAGHISHPRQREMNARMLTVRLSPLLTAQGPNPGMKPPTVSSELN